MADIYYYCESESVAQQTATTLQCSTQLVSVPLPELATDHMTAILGTIVDFDVSRISMIIAIYLVFFVTGVGVGVTMRQMRRA